MNIIIIIILVLLLIISILIAYDYKASPKEFSFSIKRVLKGLLRGVVFYIVALFITGITYKIFIPINKNHGMSFNAEREKLGIPTLKPDWQEIDSDSDQFTTYWWKTGSREGHFKKVIEYGFWDFKAEIDYYHNKKRKEISAWSKYFFEENKFEYFMRIPSEDKRISQVGEWKVIEDNVIKSVSKEEFDHFINE